MIERAEPLAVQIDPDQSVTDLLVEVAAASPDLPLLARPAGDGWENLGAAEVVRRVRALAAGLAASGVAPGDRVALLSRTRLEWTLADYAIWWAGAVTVPVYETSSAEQAAWIISDSGCTAAIVEQPRHRALLESVAGETPALDPARVWVIDDGGFEAVEALGRDASLAVDDAELERRRAAVTGADLATIIYTSGTTGRPKGCRLTHANFVVLSRNAVAAIPEVFAVGASTLLFLPLAHVFARFVQVLCLAGRTTLAHTADTTQLTRDLASFQPTYVLAVPRVFEKVYASAEQKAIEGGKGKVFTRAAAVAEAYSRAADAGADGGRGPGLALRAQHAVFDRLVYAKLRAALGGRAQYAVSGGGPLGERLGHFFKGVGITVLQGYGLTETTAPTTVNRPERVKVASVGRPLPGCSVRIDSDGEVLVKGPHVFAGYWGDAKADAEAFDADGWFRTGDLGALDDEGFLSITGRKKEIIVTAGGKNVAPAVLEDRLRAHPIISQALVVGDARPFVACLLTLDPDVLPGWLRARGMPVLDVAAAAHDAGVRAVLQEAVDQANAAVSHAEAIKKFAVLKTDFTEANGLLTPSLKLRRRQVMAAHAEAVEELYSSRS
ncbi:long-chain acyl-CoA synthetase [Quadrisphaera granulorum]|uniref:Long-chain acyl-CoA synthetase n=1 Tax=Quadrisphaera granulorum TaxID=317664 RepID=A0A315ZZK5_9ACTN|nr:AMP-dependent synthetase/ligase [Quadrisphaera granulorum]PWJ49884.1 long-chain acyl-CoA synthetase [Quadrisphaera granulorum]SZE98092.1 long-chain acyl-CoA synthetase [Quadrisphaera granulorum]